MCDICAMRIFRKSSLPMTPLLLPVADDAAGAGLVAVVALVSIALPPCSGEDVDEHAVGQLDRVLRVDVRQGSDLGVRVFRAARAPLVCVRVLLVRRMGARAVAGIAGHADV